MRGKAAEISSNERFQPLYVTCAARGTTNTSRFFAFGLRCRFLYAFSAKYHLCFSRFGMPIETTGVYHPCQTGRVLSLDGNDIAEEYMSARKSSQASIDMALQSRMTS